MAGDERVVAGSLKNKVMVTASRFMPDSVKAEIASECTQAARPVVEALRGRLSSNAIKGTRHAAEQRHPRCLR